MIGQNLQELSGPLSDAEIYIDDTQDAGRKMVVGIDRIMTIAKGRYINDEEPNSPYHNTDFATIGIFYSKED